MNYLITLDDHALTDVSNLVRIVDVIELRPGRTTTAKERLGMPGSVLTRDHLASRQVRIQFVLLTDDHAARTAALSDITAWAMAGTRLKLSDRPGQQLHVNCTETPLTMSKRKWTDLCEMTFTAFALPFWEDVTPTECLATLTEGTLVITPPGNVRQVPLVCSVTPGSDTLTHLTIAANEAEMAFTGLHVPAGKTLRIDQENGLLTARWTADDGSLVPCLSCRTGAETIPLYTNRQNTVQVAANTACTIRAGARGWYW